MQISELKAGASNVTIEAEVTSVDEPREVLTKFGKRTRVSHATLKDESGEIQLTLWGDDIDKVAIGDKIVIENGWVSEFKGNIQLSTGKYGKIIKK